MQKYKVTVEGYGYWEIAMVEANSPQEAIKTGMGSAIGYSAEESLSEPLDELHNSYVGSMMDLLRHGQVQVARVDDDREVLMALEPWAGGPVQINAPATPSSGGKAYCPSLTCAGMVCRHMSIGDFLRNIL